MHPFSLALLWVALSFPGYYFLAKNQQLSMRLWRLQPNIHPGIKLVLVQRGWGVLLMGVGSLVLVLSLTEYPASAYGLGLKFQQAPPWWIWPCLPLIPLMAWKQAPSPANLAMYPQIRKKSWSPATILVSALSWIAFLIAYEFLFRGVLLSASLFLMEPWQAVALNISIYALAHMYKGPGETFGAIPVGIALCYLTIHTGNIWMAVLIHSIMALSNEWFSLRAHPDMQVKKFRGK